MNDTFIHASTYKSDMPESESQYKGRMELIHELTHGMKTGFEYYIWETACGNNIRKQMIVCARNINEAFDVLHLNNQSYSEYLFAGIRSITDPSIDYQDFLDITPERCFQYSVASIRLGQSLSERDDGEGNTDIPIGAACGKSGNRRTYCL